MRTQYAFIFNIRIRANRAACHTLSKILIMLAGGTVLVLCTYPGDGLYLFKVSWNYFDVLKVTERT